MARDSEKQWICCSGMTPFTTVAISYLGNEIEIENVLVDTGSASTIFAAGVMANVNIIPETDDQLYVICGVGGSETAFCREIDFIRVGEWGLNRFEIEVGGWIPALRSEEY